VLGELLMKKAELYRLLELLIRLEEFTGNKVTEALSLTLLVLYGNTWGKEEVEWFRKKYNEALDL
jgi:hypothetical protein